MKHSSRNLILITFAFAISSVVGTFQNQMYNVSYDTSVYQCLVQQGTAEIGINIWFFNLINNTAQQAQNAHSAQTPIVDLYIFLSPGTQGNSPPSVPISQIVDSIKTNNINYTNTWLMLDYGGQWSSDTSKNQQYLLDFVSGAKSAGLNNIGLHANGGWWPKWFGSQSWSDPSLNSLPLIYVGYGSLDFSDWDTLKFGGWSQPYGKQYDPQSAICDSFSYGVWRP